MQPDTTVNRTPRILLLAALAFLVTACGGGGGGSTPPANNEQDVSGGGVKGPLANANVSFYEFDANFSNFQAAAASSSGTTNDQAKFVGVTLGSGSTAPKPPYILVFNARAADPATNDPGTTDLTTGAAPVIQNLKTVVTQEMLDSGANLYATPLTTMAVDMAIANALSGVAPYTGTDFNSNATVDKFLAALPIAAAQVRESVGFGLPATVDIFDTPPLMDDTVDAGNVGEVAEYRQAVEALSAVVYEMAQQTSSASPDEVLSELTDDLADGAIDGQTKSGSGGTAGAADTDILSEAVLDILNVDPATLNIPGTSTPVTDVELVLNNEVADTGSTATVDATIADAGATTVAVIDPDRDGDGVLNSNDAFPDDGNETTDTDGDGQGDNSDNDIDGDGVLNADDFAPTDAAVQIDPSVVAGATDADGDGVDDGADNCPALYNPAQADMDTDTEGDACDTDIDGDTVLNAADAFPLNAGETIDTDGDGVGNNTDADNDNDGVLNTAEAGQGTNPLVADTDGDGRNDKVDKCPTDSNEWLDTDGDGTCNGLDTDADNDLIDDVSDAFPNDPRADTDTDGDGVADDVFGWDGTVRTTVNAALSDADDDNDGLLDTVESNSGTFVDSTDTGTDPKAADSDSDGLNDNVETGTGAYLGVVNTGTNPNMADTDSDGLNDNVENNSGTFVSASNTGTDPNVADTDGDGVNDGAETDTGTFVGASDTGTDPHVADTDADGLNDGAEVTAGTNPFVTDTDSDGLTDGEEAGAGGTGTNPIVADSDGDGINDGAENTAGTNPLSDDTDSDTILDAVDNCPLTANTNQTDTDMNGVGDACEVDTDGDMVPDSLDNCPAVANQDQANQDSDAFGDVCDADRDGDGVDNTADAFPDNAAETADSDSDGTGDNADPCPMDATDACVTTLDMTGVQKLTFTITNVSEPVTNGCDGDMVGDTESAYVTTTQSGTALTMKTMWNDTLTGTVNTTTGAYTLNGVSTEPDPFSTGVVVTDTIAVSGNAMSGTGTITITEAIDGTDECVVTFSMTSANVYKHVAGEDYNGVYGLELADDDGRNSFAVQFEVTGSTMAIHLPYKDPNETISNTSFDPNTGFFSFDLDGVDNYDDGSGSEEWHDKLSGILVRAPGDSSGLPTVALAIDLHSGEYDAVDGSAGAGTRIYTDRGEEMGYGKAMSSTGFTRSGHFRSSATGSEIDGIFMGMSHPPLKTATELYVEVLDGAVSLCTSPYSSRYTNAHYEPSVDMTMEEFQSQFYSFVTCDTSGGTGTHIVTDGMDYTVRIMDMGADAAVGGGDDSTVTSMVVTAEVNLAFFTETPSANSFALNGATASKTMKQGNESGLIHMFGFFDVNEDMAFSWTGLTGATSYSLQLKEDKMGIEQTRFSLTTPAGGTESITLPAGTMDMWDGNVIRVRARKDGTTAEHRALSTSKWIQVSPGIRGLFNVEFIDTPIQLFMEGSMGDGTNASLDVCAVTNSPMWTCNSGTIDYSTNTVSLNMDNPGDLGAVTMDITFSDSGNGTITGGSLATALSLVPAETHVRLVNPELAIRSLQPSGGVAQQSIALLFNTMAGGELAAGNMFDKAVFKRDDNANLIVGGADTGTAGKSFWNEATAGGSLPFTGEAAAFWRNPSTDGVAQKTGHYLFNRTNSDWSLGAGLLDGAAGAGVLYKSVWTNSVDSTLKWVFKKTYTAPDASVLVTPIHNQVIVNLTAGDVVATTSAGTGVGEVGNPIDVSAEPTFGGLTWTGSVPAGGEWEIRFTMVAGPLAGAEMRTPWMDATTHADLTDNGNGTWTWVNPDSSIWLDPGETVQVQIRAREGSAFTMLGAQRTGGTDDTVYLINP